MDHVLAWGIGPGQHYEHHLPVRSWRLLSRPGCWGAALSSVPPGCLTQNHRPCCRRAKRGNKPIECNVKRALDSGQHSRTYGKFPHQKSIATVVLLLVLEAERMRQLLCVLHI